ncbi:ABC-F family ATP-binding cassette domain-containing protein [Paenisporosarcina quisquiliarum]|uniref:ABC-F family ATP-binding cassette domain-containing protein n=1 Tax=Paenisporosarcina quisquiliarum TaxID=365346 RepID=A0A9X3LEI4_9BACL|nr:ABC-F family ATP-binding cassette domain-containing protein [Paenisporosarcina quisquiliarum]MCZ8535849.1 ABC-F family ATP-binding cassette domain-containing protein [Paenisporosarcina quisquiliarum]
MSHLIVSNLTKTVGEKTLFENIDFTIYAGERAGLIGVNGTGKSTFLSIISKQIEADSLSMDHPNQYRIAFLEQDPQFDDDLTVLQAVFSGDSPALVTNRKYEDALNKLSEDSSSVEYQDAYMEIQSQMDLNNAWDINSMAKTALQNLGIDMFDRKVNELSGGQLKRVALAKVLVEPADLILLDEPTNHLDVQSSKWLQESLARLSSAIIFVTHDRYFLDGVSTHIYEIADQTMYTHRGNYGDYLEARAIREDMAASSQLKLQNRFRSELKWIRRGAKARTTKQKARIQRFDKLDEQMERHNDNTSLEMNLATTRLGKKVLEGINLSKAYENKQIIKDFSFLLQPGDRIGIVGPNGAGKSTLINMLAEKILPDSGELSVGQTVKIAHFEQTIPPMNPNTRMIEYVRESSNDIEGSDGVRHSAAQMLERFLFPLKVHGTPIGKLSGGERKRLHLLKLLMEQPNVLLLDEPTNDLDIQTLSVLEDFIEQFPGVVITISHDRFFLDRIAKKLWVLDGKGNTREVQEIYSDFLEQAPEILVEPVVIVEQQPEPVKTKEPKKKLSFKEQKEWETIESDIEKIEEAIIVAEKEVESAGADFEKLQKATNQLEALNEQYNHLIERWGYLQEIIGS